MSAYPEQTDMVHQPTEVACRYCGSISRADNKYCWYCWVELVNPITDLEQASRLRGSLARGRLVRRVIRLGLLLSGLAAIVLYSLSEVVNQPVPQPSGDANVVVASDAWGMLGRDIAHTAWVRDGRAVRGEPLWRFQTEAQLLASPVIAGGVVYQVTGDRRFVALDASDGRVIWSQQTTGPLSTSPAVTADTVYVGLRDGQLWALRREDGEPRWIRRNNINVSTSPTVLDGVLYVGFGDGTLRAFDAENGVELWSYDTGTWVVGAPAIHENILAITNQDGDLHLIDVKTGLKRLDYSVLHLTKDPPAFSGDKLIFASDRGQLTVLDSAKLEFPLEKRVRTIRMELFMLGLQGNPPVAKGFVWGAQFPSDVPLSAPAVTEDRVYVNTQTGRLFALDLATGEALWEYDAGASSDTSPVVVGDFVYMGTQAGDIHVVNRHGGIAETTFHVGGPLRGQIVVADSRLFVVSQDGALYAFE